VEVVVLVLPVVALLLLRIQNQQAQMVPQVAAQLNLLLEVPQVQLINLKQLTNPKLMISQRYQIPAVAILLNHLLLQKVKAVLPVFQALVDHLLPTLRPLLSMEKNEC
jgi:hypothetical protein